MPINTVKIFCKKKETNVVSVITTSETGLRYRLLAEGATPAEVA